MSPAVTLDLRFVARPHVRLQSTVPLPRCLIQLVRAHCQHVAELGVRAPRHHVGIGLQRPTGQGTSPHADRAWRVNEALPTGGINAQSPLIAHKLSI